VRVNPVDHALFIRVEAGGQCRERNEREKQRDNSFDHFGIPPFIADKKKRLLAKPLFSKPT
jgi:hypothetical protein